jgi:hypothetical protein
MRWIYRIAALGVLPFGMVSILEDFPQLWAGSDGVLALTGVGTLMGFAILLPGVLNLLNDSYGDRAYGLRVTTLCVNLPMTLLFIRLEAISGERGMFLLLPVLFAAMSVFSLGMVIKGGGGEKPSPTDGSSAEGLSEKGNPGGEEA